MEWLMVLFLGGLWLPSVALVLIALVVLLTRGKKEANREILSSLGAHSLPPPFNDRDPSHAREDHQRVNEQIRISPVRLIGVNGEQLGVVSTQQALDMARAANLDLVEVAPSERPPVCKIMDYGNPLSAIALEQKAKRRRCPQCGTEVRPDAPEGLCPQCLLKEAMKSEADLERETGATAAHPACSKSPDLEELGQYFPQLEIVELLGQGGMGIVYKARQRRLDRFVALKILPGQAGGDSAFAERFAREARALAKLTHPSVVTVYDFGESDGRFYLLMEFVEGVNLRHLLRERRLKPEEALKIVPQICEALQYAHEQGVIHRDIKPENILLDKKGHVKIADFGLAKLLGAKATDSALTGSQQIMGTFHYMAPEQMERPLTVDHRADIYSLGVVFYEMLTGELPMGRFAPPSQKVQVDVRLDEVVLRALEKEPERRYQHASDVKAEVETIQDSALGSGGPHGANQENMNLRERRVSLKHDLPVSPSSLLNSPGTLGILLCVLGIGAGFIPAVIRHLNPSVAGYQVYRRLQPHQLAGHSQQVSVPDTGMFRLDGEISPEWCCITATFLALGVFLIATHSVWRMAIRRGFAMLLAGTAVLVLNVLRAQPMFGSAELSTTPYIGFYVAAALAVGLLILGAMALRFALMNSNPDADAQAMSFMRRKLHSLWESALSICVGSRVKEASSTLTGEDLNDAHLRSATLEEERAMRSDAQLPGTTPEAYPVECSPKLSAMEKLGSRGCLLWFLIVTFAFIVIAIMAGLALYTVTLESSTAGVTVDVVAPTGSDVRRIQGTWLAISVEHNGQVAPNREVEGVTMTFGGDKVKVIGFKGIHEEEEGTFQLGSTQRPKWLDLTLAKRRMPGIYKLDADSLTICVTQDEGGERPKTFTTDRGTALSLIVLKRQKP
jgi:uncharacterized protein (TIGR03067 family)